MSVGSAGGADREDMAREPDADLREQLPRDGAGRDARRGFARAGALEDVAHVAAAVLGDAGQVGVAGARPGDRRAPRAARIRRAARR